MRALIVDLRETAGPSPRETTRAILAGLADARTSLVVLVDRWTVGDDFRIADGGGEGGGHPVDQADEGEQLAIALASAARARIVGTQTAGLRGELESKTLPASGIVVSFPAARREAPVLPHVPVDLAAPSGGPGDPILYQALKVLERR